MQIKGGLRDGASDSHPDSVGSASDDPIPDADRRDWRDRPRVPDEPPPTSLNVAGRTSGVNRNGVVDAREPCRQGTGTSAGARARR